jgi:DNA mismatch repair protein MutL
MGRIHVLTDQVANQIAAGEVVDRPASVVKEMLENSLDAGATRIRVDVEAGGRKLIRLEDDGCGMMRDDALLAFERHATSKIRSSDDLLTIATLGFRGEALPSIASVSRLEMTTRAEEDASGTRIEIAGGKILAVEDFSRMPGTTITLSDLFFNTPARRKFLKSETTELSHITALVTNYALAHPEKYFSLHSPSQTILEAPPVAKPAERIFQIFGKETLDHLLPVAAETQLDRSGLPEPPPWRRASDYVAPEPGHLRLKGFLSKPELQKLNRNSMYVFVNQRLVRDRLLIHAITEAYRNLLPSSSFPVVLLYLEMPPGEVDVNVHPAKTEVRFRQQGVIHDFVRDSLRNTLIQARPAAEFVAAIHNNPLASASLAAGVPTPANASSGSPTAYSPKSAARSALPSGELAALFTPANSDHSLRADGFSLSAPELAAEAVRLPFSESLPPIQTKKHSCGSISEESLAESPQPSLQSLGSLKPLGQLRESFILAVNEEGLWIIDQHVAHERVLFEKILRERETEKRERQQLLLPLLVDLTPSQMIEFATLADELVANGFEVEPFGPRTLAIKAAPAGLEGLELEHVLTEVIEQSAEERTVSLETLRTRIAASIACHAAIKVNMPLDQARMEWLLSELAKTGHPTSCPHGRPIALRYAWREIQKAFQRI